MLNGRHRLPSGFGTIRNLGAGRRRPFAVHPPAVKEIPSEDVPGGCRWRRPPAICYVSAWESGLKILALYHAGMYKDGIEDLIEGGAPLPECPETKEVLCQYCQEVLDDIERIKNGERPSLSASGSAQEASESKKPTFDEVYASFYEYKYGSHAQRKLKKSTMNATNAAYKRFAPFYSRTLDEISVDDMQNLVNRVADEGLSKATVTRVVTLAHQLYKFAYPRDLCSRETGRYVEMPAAKTEEHHQDFTDEELQTLWAHKGDPIVKNVLVMCYSGYRVNEYADAAFAVHLDAPALQEYTDKAGSTVRRNDADGMRGSGNTDTRTSYFRGGFKTEAGHDRVVPIHSAILEMVREMNGIFFAGMTTDLFRERMKDKLLELGIDGKMADGSVRYHTPHSCRHTFSRLCESYGVNEADRRRMMGHSLKNDVTNGVYGHRTVSELSREMEKIKVA